MNEEEFVKQLNEAHQLMKDEKFKESIIILEKLKDVEKKGEYSYGITHKLYQLISNAHSLYHQQEIQKFMGELLLQQKTITYHFFLTKPRTPETSVLLNDGFIFYQKKITTL